VADDETTAASLTVTAISTEDTGKSGSATVTVTESTIYGQAGGPGLYISDSANPLIAAGTTFASALAWLKDNAVSDTAYTILLGAGEDSRAVMLNSGALHNATGVSITLRGKDTERMVQLTGAGSLFTVDPGVTLILDNNITLKGVYDNTATLVRVNAGGTLEMRDGAQITGNTNTNTNIDTNNTENSGGVATYGTFTMRGGRIWGNTHTGTTWDTAGGGGVYVGGGTFTMARGEIHSNTGRAKNLLVTGNTGGYAYWAAGSAGYIDGAGWVSGTPAGGNVDMWDHGGQTSAWNYSLHYYVINGGMRAE
jgi:hypothetical protein